ncbi:MAG: hypothetical protein RLY43_611 [Bacteroidota bacterium]|jgi:hypothetical protein
MKTFNKILIAYTCLIIFVLIFRPLEVKRLNNLKCVNGEYHFINDDDSSQKIVTPYGTGINCKF